MPSLSAARLAEWSTRGPRYTSYPTATEFAPVHEVAVQRELARLTSQGPISLYVHVPFCKSLCWYCGCNVIPTRDVSRGDRYVETLALEAELLAKAAGRRLTVTEIALGGGSPNFLSSTAIDTLMSTIDRCFNLAPDARRSLELDPRDTTTAQLDLYAAAGFRSLSVGVQDFSQSVQEAIHRFQSREQTAALIEHARSRGFVDVNVDIVYGLPHQTEASFARTLDAVLALQPDRIALFGYAHLPSKLPHQLLVERAGRILDPIERAALLLLAIEQLTSAGYLHLGLDHFARPDSPLARAAADRRMVRSFQGYTEHHADSTIGLGTSAISSTPTMYWQNYSDLDSWGAAINAGKLAVARGILVDEDDQLRRAIITDLMCDGVVDLGEVSARFNVAPADYFAEELVALSALPELASYDSDTQIISATTIGKLLVRNVCMLFDRHLATASHRFSTTI